VLEDFPYDYQNNALIEGDTILSVIIDSPQASITLSVRLAETTKGRSGIRTLGGY